MSTVPVPRIGIAIVRGTSMQPTLSEGDRLLVLHGARPRAGRIAVVRFADGVVAVKRLDHLDAGRLVGDARQRRARAATRGRPVPCLRATSWPWCWADGGRGRASWLHRSDMAEPEDPRAQDPAFALHVGGKMEIASRVALNGPEELSLAYTPGVARVCEAIAEDESLAADYTWVSNTVAVVTDGTAVLGLGDIGPKAAMPVMEGKAVLFKQFGGVDAVPICLDTTDVDEIVETVARLAPSFGGINLEDISAPRCFEIEDRLKQRLDIPVFHDDQHGTAVVVLAALENALRADRPADGDDPGRGLRRRRRRSRGHPHPAGRRHPRRRGHRPRAGCCTPRAVDLNDSKRALAEVTADVTGRTGSLADVMAGADVFIGVSGGTVPEDVVATMAPDAMIFGLANPNPEVHPDVAHRHARVVATGRSDFPNQINNVLAFPGIFRGAFDARATAITEGMKLAAADALAAIVGRRRVRGLRSSPRPSTRGSGPVCRRRRRGRPRDGVARA